MVSWAALQTAVLPRALNYLGLTAGVAGLITVIPALEAVGAVFGIGLIIWFAWLGVLLLTEEAPGDGHTHRGEESLSRKRT